MRTAANSPSSRCRSSIPVTVAPNVLPSILAILISPIGTDSSECAEVPTHRLDQYRQRLTGCSGPRLIHSSSMQPSGTSRCAPEGVAVPTSNPSIDPSSCCALHRCHGCNRQSQPSRSRHRAGPFIRHDDSLDKVGRHLFPGPTGPTNRHDYASTMLPPNCARRSGKPWWRPKGRHDPPGRPGFFRQTSGKPGKIKCTHRVHGAQCHTHL